MCYQVKTCSGGLLPSSGYSKFMRKEKIAQQESSMESLNYIRCTYCSIFKIQNLSNICAIFFCCIWHYTKSIIFARDLHRKKVVNPALHQEKHILYALLLVHMHIFIYKRDNGGSKCCTIYRNGWDDFCFICKFLVTLNTIVYTSGSNCRYKEDWTDIHKYVSV